MKVLVTGGAGYIGSFITRKLLDEGHEVVVVDSLERGHREAVDKRASFVFGNLLDKNFIKDIFQAYGIDVVMHFAAYILVGESMEKPGMYFINNVFGALHLLEEMVNYETNTFIFSSSAAVYGKPLIHPIVEDHPKNPLSPYGETKFMIEKILSWYHKIHKINFAALRYFNAAGASLDGLLGESHKRESHIIPNAISAALAHGNFDLFGNDYHTSDGTCVRDYIHVLDLVEAHLLALKKLEKENGEFYYNVGTGKGYSNKEVIDMVKKVSGKNFTVSIKPRREGDPDILIADPSKINQELEFSPRYSDLETIVTTAWQWYKDSKY